MSIEKIQVPEGYRILDAEGLRHLIADLPLGNWLGGGANSWRIEKVGDGNLNLVFFVRGNRGGFAVKRLSYKKLIANNGESATPVAI